MTIRREAIEEGFKILPTPADAEHDALIREIHRVRPANPEWNDEKGGSGARDAVIWLTVLAAAKADGGEQTEPATRDLGLKLGMPGWPAEWSASVKSEVENTLLVEIDCPLPIPGWRLRFGDGRSSWPIPRLVGYSVMELSPRTSWRC